MKDQPKTSIPPGPTNDPPPPVLDYGRPDGSLSASQIFAGLCCIPAALGGVLFLVIGAISIYLGFTEPSIDSMGFFGRGAFFLLGGAIVTRLAIQWAMHAFFGYPIEVPNKK